MRLWIGVLLLGLVSSACAAPMHEEVEESFNFWPLARYERGIRPEGYTLDVLWPLVHLHRSGSASRAWFLPLYVHTDDGQGKTFTDVLGLHWQRRDESTGSHEWNLFPVFWWQRGGDVELTHVWPLWGRKREQGDNPSRTDWYVWPLARWHRTDDGQRSELSVLDLDPLVTLLDGQRRPSGPPDGAEFAPSSSRWRALSVLGGLFSAFSSSSDPNPGDAGGSADAWHVASVFDEVSLLGASTATAADGTVIAESAHAFPLFAHGREADGSSHTWVLPPLLGLSEDPSTGQSAVDVLWPLGRYESYADDDPRWHLRALPLVWLTKRLDAQVDLVLPLYYRVRDSQDDYLHLIPLYGRHVLDGGDKRRTFVVPPLWIHTTDVRNGTDRHDVLWPLSAFSRSDDAALARVFPLFFHSRDADQRHLNLALAFDARSEGVDEGSTLLWPLLGHADRGGNEEWSWLPLLDARFVSPFRPDGDSTSVLFPLAHFARDGDASRRWIAPFIWWFDDGKGNAQHHVWPLYGIERRADGFVKHSSLFPLFHWGGNVDGSERSLGLLYPLGGWETSPSETSHRFLPLWYHSQRHDRDQHWSWVLWPLFSHSSEPDGSRLVHSLGWLYRHEQASREQGGAEDTWVLGGLFRSRRTAQRSSHSVAFLWSYENDGTDRVMKLFHLIPISL